jgi:hypothetical protein
MAARISSNMSNDLLVDLDAVGCEHVRAEEPCFLEHPDSRRPGRGHEPVGERLPRPRAGSQELGLRLALGEVCCGREAELVARAVEIEADGVRRVRRDAHADVVGERARDPLAHGCEAIPDLCVRLAEDLEVDQTAEAGVGAGGRRRSDEAAVADGRDPGAEALERAETRDRLHVAELDALLSLDVERDPRGEVEPVSEPGVDGVFEVAVGVDEAREDHRARVSVSFADLRRRADCGDEACVVDRDGAVLDRGTLDGHDPVCGQDPHTVPTSTPPPPSRRPSSGASVVP